MTWEVGERQSLKLQASIQALEMWKSVWALSVWQWQLTLSLSLSEPPSEEGTVCCRVGDKITKTESVCGGVPFLAAEPLLWAAA